jgi:hypothetical protein
MAWAQRTKIDATDSVVRLIDLKQRHGLLDWEFKFGVSNAIPNYTQG